MMKVVPSALGIFASKKLAALVRIKSPAQLFLLSN